MRSVYRLAVPFFILCSALSGCGDDPSGHVTPSPSTRTGGTGGAGGDNELGGSGVPPEQELAGDIVFSVPSGTFEGQLVVEISTALTGAEIHYTTDGQLPTASSPLYSGPVQLTSTSQLRAQAVVSGVASGLPGTAIYVARSFDVALDLPIVILDAYGAGEPGRDSIDAAFLAIEPVAGTASLSSAPSVATRAGFHLRGQSTATFEKTPYRVELRGNDDDDLDWPLLGMPSESDWALRGPFADKALIRDAFFYGLGRDMGLSAPRFAFCELYRNVSARPLSAEDYMGVYLIVETIKNQKDRLNLKQLKSGDTSLPEITGGYILNFDWLAAEEPMVQCIGDTRTCFSDLEVIDPSPLGPEQEAWITDYVQTFHDTLNSASFADPAAGYQAYIEPESFVDHLIINELGREMDSYIRSTYFHKDRDGKLVAGPLWDYNLVFGVGGFFENAQTAGWQYQQQREPVNTDWYLRLMDDPAFVARVVARWQQLRQGLFSDAQLDARISSLAAPLVNGAARNFARWPNLSASQIAMFRTPNEPTWEGQVQFVRSWLSERVAWLDTQWR